MKTFKEILAEVAEPKSADEKHFKDKHIIQKTMHPAFKSQAEQDAVFNGTGVVKDNTKLAGHHSGEDEEVYEEVKLDEKKLTPAELKKREEIAKSIERDNPNMPMDKKMAIATATAKKVAEEQKLDELSPELKKRYADKAKSDYKHQKFSADIAKDMNAPDAEKHYRRKQLNRAKGMHRASEAVEENFNWKVSHGGKDVHVKAPHAGAAVKKAQKGFGNMDLTKAKVSNLGKVGTPTNEATVDTANIRSRQAMKKSDVDKLGKLANMLAKERKPKQEATDKPPFDPDPKKKNSKNSDGSKTAPMSRARQLAKQYLNKKNESIEEGDNFEKNFTKRIGATVRGGKGAEYLKKKAKEYQALNKKLDPGADKKGLGIGVTDSQKAYQKAKKKGVQWPRSGVRTSPNTRNPGRLPEEIEQIDEVGRMSPKVGKASYTAPAKELKAYAQKSGGIDKKDFMMVADMLEKLDRINILQAGQLLGQLSNKLKNMDTSPREKVLSVLHSHGHNVGNFGGYKMRGEQVEENNSAPQSAAHRRAQMGSRYSDLQKKVKLKGFGPDAAKGNMGNPSARAALKPKNEELEEANAAMTLKKAASSKSGTKVKFGDGTQETIDQQTAQSLLDVHGRLNSNNKKKFEDNIFKSGQDFMKMVDFAMSRN